MENQVKCPLCPVCDSEPLIPISPMFAQAFCSNEDCKVLCWEPFSTLDENLLNMQPAIITENGEPRDGA